jgi:hypothetical protein
MSDAHVDFGAGTMETDQPVSIGYGESEITGDHLSVSRSGKIITVEGSVHTVLSPPNQPAANAPATAE